MPVHRCLSPGIVALAAGVLAGCATTRSPPPEDPWESINRATYRFNDRVDRVFLKPVAQGYRRAVPRFARTGVTNFLTNLAYPTTLLNSLLQGKPVDALSDAARLALNTTLGLGGLLDPATDAGLPRHDEDFGQTLGRWGVPAGPYVVIPFLGPSTLRDTPVLYADYLTNLRRYASDEDVELALGGLAVVDRRARLIPVEQALAGAFDPYALLRNAFLQRREYLVRDGDLPEEAWDEGAWLEGEDREEPAPGP